MGTYIKKYADEDGNNYELVPHPMRNGDRCGVGCALSLPYGCCGLSYCTRAPTCTPTGLKGRHVWKLVKHWLDKPINENGDR